MKTVSLLCLFFLIFLVSCEKDDESFPASDSPGIALYSPDAYSNPGRDFLIKAKITDDLGLKSIEIVIPEFHLDKTIDFKTDSLVKDYDLSYKFKAPADTKNADTYTIQLHVTDVSGNTTSKNISLHMNGDFNPPALKNLKPVSGSVFFKSDNMKLKVSFTAEDESGLEYVLVKLPELDIYDSIYLSPGKNSYSYSNSFPIPSDLKSYQLQIVAKDRFVEPNILTSNVEFSISTGLEKMYLADLPKNSNLVDNDIFGIPMLFHDKTGDEFLFKYYADKDNKEIYLLGQNISFEPHCFGLDGSGNLINDVESCLPIMLPKKGYYQIRVNGSALTYSVTAYTPTTPPRDLTAVPIRLTGSGFVDEGWDPSNTTCLLSADPQNPYRLQRDLSMNGKSVSFTVTGPGWNPFWRVDKEGVSPFGGGANATFDGAEGTYQFTLDTELERSFLIKK